MTSLGLSANYAINRSIMDDEAEDSNIRLKRKREDILAQAADTHTCTSSLLLSTDDVKDLLVKVSADRDALLGLLANEKLTNRIDKLRSAINSFSDAISKISSAYIAKLEVENVVGPSRNALAHVCNRLEQASTALANVARTNGPPANVTFAQVAARAAPFSSDKPSNSVALNKGGTFAIKSSKRVVIEPHENNKSSFPSAKETKFALLKAVDPVKLKINAQRIFAGANSSVIVEGDCLDALQDCSELKKIGLEIKQDTKLQPRIIIHDIPVDLTGDDIVNCVIEQNIPDASRNDLKIVYIYPVRDKKFRSCVIETKPSIRNQLLNKRRININWQSCRIDDHVSLLQCFKCQRFGHVASTCKFEDCCGNCSGAHLTNTCSAHNARCCINCKTANLTNTTHTATDRLNCPILRKKIEQKISFINYGDD